MAFTFDLNNTVDREVDALLTWKDALKANGMTVVESGDGNGGNFSGLGGGDVLTVASSTDATANSIGNRQAWFRGQWPNGREMIWQHSNVVDQQSGHIRYSAAAGFSGTDDGSPSATIAPTAADQQFVMGNTITAAANLFSSTLNTGTGLPADETGRGVLQMCFGDADEDYSWYALQWARGNGQLRGGMWMDSLTSSPTYVSDGVVVGIIGDEVLDDIDSSHVFDGRVDGTPDTSNNRSFAWGEAINAGLDNKMLSCFLLQYGYNSNPGQQNSNPAFPALGEVTGITDWTGGYDLYPAHWFVAGRTDTDAGRTMYLGESRLFKVMSLPDPIRDVSDDLNWRFVAGIAVVWDGVTGDIEV